MSSKTYETKLKMFILSINQILEFEYGDILMKHLRDHGSSPWWIGR